jgi:hypothetical protein
MPCFINTTNKQSNIGKDGHQEIIKKNPAKRERKTNILTKLL